MSEGKLVIRDRLGRMMPGSNLSAPKGLPPAGAISARVKFMLAEIDPEDELGRTRTEVLASIMYEKAKHNRHYLAMILDRSEGKPVAKKVIEDARSLNIKDMSFEDILKLAGQEVIDHEERAAIDREKIEVD